MPEHLGGVAGSMPAASISVAAKWRSECRCTWGISSSTQSVWTTDVRVSGFTGRLPSGKVETMKASSTNSTSAASAASSHLVRQSSRMAMPAPATAMRRSRPVLVAFSPRSSPAR